jgi:putative PIN family toxin of toxin-antitoxin system
MRLVIDANVIISRVLNPKGTPAQIVQRWEDGAFTVLVSVPILEEYAAVLRYERLRKIHGWNDAEIDDFVARLAGLAQLVATEGTLHVVPEDPDDDKFLECALEGRADTIVTGDEHLLALGSYEGVFILRPAQFLAQIENEL